MPKWRNFIIISLDEVRPDHLSCYGYSRIKTSAIDQVASEGVLFQTCISSSDFTPVAMASVITGKYPNKHGMRDAYSHLVGPSLAKILQENGYLTAGFAGNNIMSKEHGFAEGFDFWNEASEKTSWLDFQYPGSEGEEVFHVGNYWVEDFFKWLHENHKEKFFVWGHLLETHEGSERSLLERGLIKEGELSEFSYYDAKIKMADSYLVRRLLETLQKLGLAENTTIVLMSDHGTNLGEHPATSIPWRDGKVYPQHFTMYDHDLRVVLIIKGSGLPRGKKIQGMARSVDIAPTLLNLAHISYQEYDFDGVSLLPAIASGKAEAKEVYAEDLFEARGDGALQCIRTRDIKFIRNLTLGEEEYYDLRQDPQEQNNLIGKIDREKAIEWRKRLNAFLRDRRVSGKSFSKQEIEKIKRRLRGLGYIE